MPVPDRKSKRKTSLLLYREAGIAVVMEWLIIN
jgi:hypothetical protein